MSETGTDGSHRRRVETSSLGAVVVATRPGIRVFHLFHVGADPSMSAAQPPEAAMSAAPPAMSHSFFGFRVAVASSLSEATRASSYGSEPIGTTVSLEAPNPPNPCLAQRRCPKCLMWPRAIDVPLGRTCGCFPCCGVVHTPSDLLAVLDQSNGDTRFRDAVDELACAIDRIHNPNPWSAETIRRGNGLHREPSFVVGWKGASENAIHREVCLCQRAAARLQRGYDRSRCELLKNAYRLVERSPDPHEIAGMAHLDSW
jgi:hypothetical protein